MYIKYNFKKNREWEKQNTLNFFSVVILVMELILLLWLFSVCNIRQSKRVNIRYLISLVPLRTRIHGMENTVTDIKDRKGWANPYRPKFESEISVWTLALCYLNTKTYFSLALFTEKTNPVATNIPIFVVTLKYHCPLKEIKAP